MIQSEHQMSGLTIETRRLLDELRATAAADAARAGRRADLEALTLSLAVYRRARQLFGRTAPLTPRLVRFLDAMSAENPQLPVTPYSDRVVKATVLALASRFCVKPGSPVRLTRKFVDLCVNGFGPLLDWRLEGRFRHEQFRVPKIKQPPEIETPKLLLAKGDRVGAYTLLVDVAATFRRKYSRRAALEFCATAVPVETAEAILRFGVQLSGSIPAGDRYRVWSAVTTDVTTGLRALWRRRMAAAA